MIEFRNETQFTRMLNRLPNELHRAAVVGLHEAMDDWMRRARVVAPEDTGFLKTEMKVEIDTALMEGSLISNAYSSRGFNYAYFLHEVGSQKGYKARKPGTSLTWLDDTYDEPRARSIMEQKTEDELRARGY